MDDITKHAPLPPPSAHDLSKISAHDRAMITATMKAVAPELIDLQTAFDKGFEAVKAYIDAELGALSKRMDTLEKTTKCALEDTMRYRHIWEMDRTYARGTVVTLNGSMWLALDATDSRPGRDGSWRMVVKNGGLVDEPREKLKR